MHTFATSAFLHKQGEPNARFETICVDCCGWDECVGCTITRSSITPSCESPLDHTSAEVPGVTLETLTIDTGYWRATNKSKTILACYNADACVGGQTDSDDFCATGYKGPCEGGFRTRERNPEV